MFINFPNIEDADQYIGFQFFEETDQLEKKIMFESFAYSSEL